MSLTTRVLVGLLAGFALGAAASTVGGPAADALAPLMRPLGALWMNAVLMTVMPLVVASLVLSVTSAADSRLVGAVGWRQCSCWPSSSSAAQPSPLWWRPRWLPGSPPMRVPTG